MNATEIIAELERLPKQEQDQVYDFLRQQRPEAAVRPAIRYADDAAFRQALGRVMDNNAELFRKLAQ